MHCLPRRAAGPAIRDLYRRERSAMSAALRDCHPDIVHAHWTYEFELAAQDSALPHVTTAHDAPFTDPQTDARSVSCGAAWVALRARPGIRRLSTVSPYLARAWRGRMAYRRPIEIIPNSIPRTGVALSRTPSGHPVLLDVTGSGDLKNVRGLLRAFRMLCDGHREAELRLVGPGWTGGSSGSLVSRAWAVAWGELSRRCAPRAVGRGVLAGVGVRACLT